MRGRTEPNNSVCDLGSSANPVNDGFMVLQRYWSLTARGPSVASSR
jgi:hypothetical protein